jgi:choline dehydrogenase-like flavoprotein
VHYDVVVAGGGMAGYVLAGRLSEDPARSVCLVEAGPDYGAFERLRQVGASLSRYAGREIRLGEHVDAETHVRAMAKGFDERGRAHGVRESRRRHASIMPTIPRANTDLTTAAIAEKLAETI